MNFKSDNTCQLNSEIMEAIMQSNFGNQNSYGFDEYSIKLKNKFSEIFEKDVAFFLTSTGTASNCLSISSLIKSYESIICHKNSHINTDECGAPAFFTGGSNLVLISEGIDKIDSNNLEYKIQESLTLKPRIQKPGCISVSQATESGTVYSIGELNEINEIASRYSLPIHMDGARFANSLVSIGCSPAEITWKSGIDVISFSGTKNGCLNAEAIVFFNLEYAKNFEYLHKKSGQLMSKTRFFAAQFLEYFNNDLWIKNANHSNNMAKLIKNVFEKNNIKIKYSVDANEIFPILQKDLVNFLYKNDCHFYSWPNEESLYRFVVSCFSTKEEIIKLNDLIVNFYEKHNSKI